MFQVTSKKTELRFGMSPLKTQQFSEELIKSQRKPERTRKLVEKPGIEPSFGRWSFRVPKMNTWKPFVKNPVSNLSENSQNPSSKVRDWLNSKEKTPRFGLERSISDLRETSRMAGKDISAHERNGSLSRRSGAAHRFLERNNFSETSKTVIKIKSVSEKKEFAKSNNCKESDDVDISTKVESQIREVDIKQQSPADDDTPQIYKSPLFQTIEEILEESTNDDNDSDDVDENTNDSDTSRAKDSADIPQKFGSILKRPGNKRKHIKHVEFLLDNVEADVIRHF